MSNYPLVIDPNKEPLSQCNLSIARKLLIIFRSYPLVIILEKSCSSVIGSILPVKSQPDSQTTGITLLAENKVNVCTEIIHLLQSIKAAIELRNGIRRNRRNRKTRYPEAGYPQANYTD